MEKSQRRSALEEDSAAVFGYYRPEIRAAPDPLTFMEAKIKYRQHAEPHMAQRIKEMKRLGVNRSPGIA